jgi:hypothetical protein
MSETYEQPEPRRKSSDAPVTPDNDAGKTPATPADDGAPGLSPAIESEGGGQNRRRTDGDHGVEAP